MPETQAFYDHVASILAERDRYRAALEEIADAEKAEDHDPCDWAVWAHDLAREALR